MKITWRPSEFVRNQWNLCIGTENTAQSIRKIGGRFQHLQTGKFFDTLAAAKKSVLEYLDLPKPNPAPRSQVEKALELYQKFSGHEGDAIAEVELPEIPPVGVVIGQVIGIAYATVRDGQKEKYYHEFQKSAAPLLISTPDGEFVYFLGGDYKFTDKGITDHA